MALSNFNVSGFSWGGGVGFCRVGLWLLAEDALVLFLLSVYNGSFKDALLSSMALLSMIESRAFNFHLRKTGRRPSRKIEYQSRIPNTSDIWVSYSHLCFYDTTRRKLHLPTTHPSTYACYYSHL